MNKITEILPRLLSHNRTQKAYYERQLEHVEKEIARLAILASNQLQLWEEPLYPVGSNEEYVLREA